MGYSTSVYLQIRDWNYWWNVYQFGGAEPSVPQGAFILPLTSTTYLLSGSSGQPSRRRLWSRTTRTALYF